MRQQIYLMLIFLGVSACVQQTPPPSAQQVPILPANNPVREQQIDEVIAVPLPVPAQGKPLPPAVEPTQTLSPQLMALAQKPSVPGGIAWVPLYQQGTTPPHIVYQQQRVLVLRTQQQWVALVGVPLNTVPGTYTVVDQRSGASYAFQVVDKKYKTQHIKLKNKRYVTPNQADLARIKRERPLIQAALTPPWRPSNHAPLPLQQPVKGRISSPFGLKRYFNGQARKPHRGIDIAAPQGRSVIAAAEGIVSNTGDYFFNGKTVFIDHGQSVVTMYCHLADIFVTSGQTVQQGEVIATVGQTGRVTGPHLHWSVSMNHTFVDPRLLID